MYYEKYYEGIYNDQYIPGTTTPQEAHEASLALLFGAEGLAYNIYDVPAGGDLIGTDGKINPNASLGRIWANDYWLTNDNWYDELFGKSTTRNEYNLSLAAGGEKQTTFLSVNYLNDQGIISNSGLRRITTRLKTDYDVKKWLQVGMNLGYTNVENKYPQNQEGLSSKNLFWVSRIVAPIYPLYVRGADKQILKDDLGITLYDYGTNEYPGLIRPVMSIANPASDLDLDMQRYDRDFYTMKGFANFFIIDGLKLALNVAYDADISRYTSKSNAYYGQIAEAGGRLTLTDRKRGALTLQQLLTYVKSFGNNNFDLLLGHETFDRQWREMSGFKQNFYDPDSEELSNAILNQTTSSLSDGYFVEGYIARLQYNYNEKYFLSGSFRRDASSRFAPENRWGNFWSVGGSWLLNKEPFLQNVGFIDFLKLKASYGAQGNDSFNNYHPYADQFEVKNSNDDFALEFVYKGNRDITWETSYNLNAGLEFTIINGLFDGSFDFFNRKVVDMLYNIPVPPSAGYDSYPDNLGSMQNTGVEFNLVTNIIRSNNLNWSVFLNGTHYKNEILELPEQWSDPDGYIDGRRIRKIGGSLYDFWYPVYAGVNPETGASQWRITNEDDTYGVTEDYAEASEKKNSASPGTSLPDIQGGFGTTFDAFGFDLSLSCTYALGGLTYDYAYQQLMHAGEAGEAGSNWHKDILNSWTPDNTNTDVPKVDYGSVDQNASSDRFLTKSDYLSFNNVTLGYTLPESILARINIGYLRVYMAADNVLLLSRRKGLDPRQNFNGTTGFIYSPIRTMSIGAKVKF